MPFMLLVFGLVVIMAAYHNTQDTLGSQLRNDIAGAKGFFMWFAAILIIGAVGYYGPARNASRLFMVLLLVCLFLANEGVFSQFSSALGASSTAPASPVGAGTGPLIEAQATVVPSTDNGSASQTADPAPAATASPTLQSQVQTLWDQMQPAYNPSVQNNGGSAPN